MKYEVVLSAYNDVDVLSVTLSGYLQQIDKDFSICIADDGSGLAVKELVDEYKDKGLNIRHVWHEDIGFRRAMILNKAVASSCADRIIFSDSDCIPSRNFISDHKRLYKEKTITTGPRVYLNEKITKDLKRKLKTPCYLKNTLKLLLLSISKRVSRAEQGIRFPDVLTPFIRKLKDVWPYGANFAVDRLDFLRVNGFDEDFVGWGGEDIDLHKRLKLDGIDYLGVMGQAVLYHLHHPKRVADDGDELLKQIKHDKRLHSQKFALNGVDNWL